MAAGTGSAAACLTSASAVYRPAGPEPTTATRNIKVKLLGKALRRRSLLRRGGLRGRRAARDRLGELPGQVLRAQPGRLEDLLADAVGEELLRQAEGFDRHVDVVVAQQPGHRVAEPAGPAVVLDHRDKPVRPGGLDDRLVDRLDPPRVDDGDTDAVILEATRHLDT